MARLAELLALPVTLTAALLLLLATRESPCTCVHCRLRSENA